MSNGNREIRSMFSKLNNIIEIGKEFKEKIQEHWQEELSKDFVSKNLHEFLIDIDFFQTKYNIPKKLRIETNIVYKNVSEKFQIKEKKIKYNYKPGRIDKAIASFLRTPTPQPEERERIRIYGKFILDPQSDFINLHNQLIAIYHNYFKKHAPSKFDSAEVSFGTFIKFTIFKNKKNVLLAIVLGIFFAFIIALLISLITPWVSTWFL